MNILHISPYYPDLEANHAGGVCMGKEIETLRKHHDVRVLTFISQQFDEKLAEKHANDDHYDYVRISKLSRVFHTLLEPWMPNYFAVRTSARFSWKLIRTVKHYHIDVIHAEYASMGQYLWIKKLFPQLKFNLTEHDMTAQSFERKLQEAKLEAIQTGIKGKIKSIYYADQLRKIISHEERYCRLSDVLFTFNEKDKRLIREYYKTDKTIVLNTFCGLEDDELQQTLDTDEKQSGTICFLGQMGRPENNRAGLRLIKIAKEVKKTIPQLQVYIVGNKPSEELKACASEANSAYAATGASDCDYIHVTGFVEDVDAYMKKAQLAVFPLDMGAGIKVKVLRAMALGIPVITGQVGAEGIDEDGEVIRLAESDETYVEAIISMLQQPDVELLESALKSQLYIRERFNWEKSRKIFEEVYRN